jgi:bifunctional UDP-N-acetylglucosamine pyrophosphorylase / glucosamine-1-phosphate N-acetyltransferase
METKKLDILILAAGLGTRMKSDLAKVLHKIDGRPLINHVCRTATALAPRKICVVVGHQGESVKQAVLSEIDESLTSFAWQKEQLGTGDAVDSAREFLENEESTLLILSGDVPSIKAETLAALIQQHNHSAPRPSACTILTVRLEDPTGYGRIVRDEFNKFQKIVEQKDATEDERRVREINAGIYCFNTRLLYETLSKITPSPITNEYYLTDVPELLKAIGENVEIYQHNDRTEIEGINNRAQLSEIERVMRVRTIKRLMLESGVTFIDPKATYVSADAKIGRDTIIFPNVTIEGSSEIGEGCTIRSNSRITNSKIGNSVEILDSCVITDSEIGNSCTVGPFAHLRGHARMDEKAKVGNFVELKKTILGRGSKANHLTYLGDATIGEKTNIGAGTITCNYDGKNKHATKIGNNVKIGSDTMLIAPIEIGDGAVTGAGSVVTKNVDANKLAVGAPARSIRTLNQDQNG